MGGRQGRVADHQVHEARLGGQNNPNKLGCAWREAHNAEHLPSETCRELISNWNNCAPVCGVAVGSARGLRLIAIESPGLRMALFAGALAGCAYLTRTAGVVLLISVPLVLIWKRERTRAAAFAAAMLPFVIGWMAWSHFRMPVSSDPQLLYYTNYFGEWRHSVGLDNIALVMWKNLDGILYTLGGLVMPGLIAAPPMKILTQTVGIAILCGIVRLVRRGVATQYALFCLASVGVLLIWTPSTERLFIPMLPLVIAGVVEEADHLWTLVRGAFRHRDRSQRITSYAFASFAAILVVYSVAAQLWLSVFYVPGMAQPYRVEESDIRSAARWIAAHAPPSARVLSGDDPLVYLYSGSSGESVGDCALFLDSFAQL